MFLFHGLVLGAWATQVPLVRERLALAPAALGLALFCISVAAIVTMPFINRIAVRFGVAMVLRAGSFVACASFVLAALAPSYTVLCIALAAFGVGFSAVDVAMNASSVRTEALMGRPVLGVVHAAWSVGSFTGSAAGAALLGAVSPGLQAAMLAAVSGGAIMVAAGRVAPLARTHDAAGRPWRDRTLLGLGGLMCLAFVVEGAVADWGGIFLHAARQVPNAHAAIGYSAFCLSMVAMRLLGDRLRTVLGTTRVLAGAFVAAFGMAVVLLSPAAAASIAGFALIGIGIANVVPALFALAGTRGGASPGAAIGVATTLGYAGVLAGPPLIGAVAEAASLSLALALVGVLCGVIAMAGLALRPRAARARHAAGVSETPRS